MTHLSVSLAWHDRAWDGHVCDGPHLNAHCIVHQHIRDSRDDIKEREHAGEEFADLEGWVPPCSRDPKAYAERGYRIIHREGKAWAGGAVARVSVGRGDDRETGTTPSGWAGGFQPDGLAVLYMANLMTHLLDDLWNAPPIDGAASLTANMAAPLDMFEVPEVKESYERVLYDAYELAGKAPQGIRTKDAKGLLDGLSSRCEGVPPEPCCARGSG